MKIRNGFVSNSSSSSFVTIIPDSYVPNPKDIYEFYYKKMKDNSVDSDTELDSVEVIRFYLDNFERLRKWGAMPYEDIIGDGDLFPSFEDAVFEQFGIGSVEQGPDNDIAITNFSGDGVLETIKRVLEITDESRPRNDG